jgi:hypothetical protein
MEVKSEEIVAKDRKLKITWSLEMEEDLRAWYNIDAVEVMHQVLEGEVYKLESHGYNQEAAAYPNTEEQRKGVSEIWQKYPWLRKQEPLT